MNKKNNFGGSSSGVIIGLLLVIIVILVGYLAYQFGQDSSRTTNINKNDDTKSLSSKVEDSFSKSNELGETDSVQASVANQKVKDSIMIVSEKLDGEGGTKVTLQIFDAKSKQLLNTKVFDTKNHILAGEFNVSGANSSFQYSRATNSYYFSTNAKGAMMPVCINEDGSCDARVYKFDLTDKAPEMVYSLDSDVENEGRDFQQWTVLDKKGEIIVGGKNVDRKYFLKKISKTGGKEVYSLIDKVGEERAPIYGDFVISPDEKYLYQAVTLRNPQQLQLRVVTLQDGSQKFETIPDVVPPWMYSDTNISYGNKYFAYYDEKLFPDTLKIYDRKAKTTKIVNLPSPAASTTVEWSLDDSKIFIFLKSGAALVDVKSGQVTSLLKSDGTKIRKSIYTWLSSAKEFLYRGKNGEVLVYDFLNKQSQELAKKDRGEIMAIQVVKIRE